MSRIYDTELWGPVVVTGGLWLALIFLLAAYVSRMWADLGGLLYVLVAPLIYKYSQAVFDSKSQSTPEDSPAQESLIPGTE